MSRPPRVLILGGDADGNLGDRAILQSTCLAVREIRPDAELTVVGRDPARLGRELGVRVIPRGPRGFAALCAAAAGSDLVLCGGGGLFQDDDSLVKMPYWGLRVLLARVLAGRVVGYALGVGPLRTAPSRLAARIAFASMERVSVRDPRARQTAQPLTRKPVTVVPDPALLLPPATEEAARSWLRERDVPLDGPPLIGVSVRRFYPPRSRLVPNHVAARWGFGSVETEGSMRVATLLARVLDEIVRRHDAHVLFLPTYLVAHEGDERLCREVLARMERPRGQVLHVDSPALYKGVASRLAALLGGRMHSTIFAASVGTPIVGLAYNQKFYGFFELMGLEDRVLDIEDFLEHERVQDLVTLLDRALERRDSSLDRVADLAREIRTFNRSILEAAA